ncbi:MAG: 4Fe-4S dicluster domain-containing protein [Desulfovibrio sp.]|nr:4Fe-4S dicluster domain-containing protein [Desulfovibrio sp.]
MSSKALLWLRRGVASCVFAGFLLLFLFAEQNLAFLAAVQIGPAILAGSIALLICLGLLAFIFGRLYCSLLCPLGLLQDGMSAINTKRKYRPLRLASSIRYGLFAIFALALLFGLLAPAGLLDPYSAFGRIMSDLFAPALAVIYNAFAWLAQKLDLSLPAQRAIVISGWLPLLIAGATFGLLLAAALKAGRFWCNYCPIGTALGFLAKKSLLRIRINPAQCIACKRCEGACKTGCIDIARLAADNSRCVACFSCLAVCPKAAITYGPAAPAPVNQGKRALLYSLLAMAAVGAPAVGFAAGGAEINRPEVTPQRRRQRMRSTPITPPGSGGLENFARRCIGCQLCVSACPNNVLLMGSGPDLLQPGMSYEYGYCRPNCVVCGEVCPAGAIEPVSAAVKKTIQIGMASVDFDRCIVHTDAVQCTACHRICPSRAIPLVKLEGSELSRPVVDGNKCIGCGGCEYICPAMPLAAIAVTGAKSHVII